MEKIRYGIVRNGEHMGIYDTREQAIAMIDEYKKYDTSAFEQGWVLSPVQANYYIRELKPREKF